MSMIIAHFDVTAQIEPEDAALHLEGVLRNLAATMKPSGGALEIWDVRPGDDWLEEEAPASGVVVFAFIHYEDPGVPPRAIPLWLRPILSLDGSGIRCFDCTGPGYNKKPWE